VVLLVLVVAALAACGDDESPYTDEGPTKLQLVTEADAICRSYDSRFVDALQGLGGADPAQKAAIAQRVAKVADELLAELRELPRPEEDRELLDRVFASVGDDLVELRRNPALLDQPEELFSESSDLATEYGFQDCADVG
jgi:hypothetical protein